MMNKIAMWVAALLLVITPAAAQTIDSLGAAGALAGTESVPVFQTANPAVKTTAAAIGNTANALNTSAITAGTLAAARMPAITGGDCTSAVGTVVVNCNSPRHPGYLSARWYHVGMVANLITGSALQASRIVCHFAPIGGRSAITITDLGVGIATAGSSNIQLAIYANSSGRPGALIGNTGSIVNTGGATAITGALAANKNVGPGGSDGGADLWFCANQNDSTATYATQPAGTALVGAQVGGAAAVDIITGAANGMINGIYCSGAGCNGGSSTFGSWPASLAGSTWTQATAGTSGNIVPQVIFKVQ